MNTGGTTSSLPVQLISPIEATSTDEEQPPPSKRIRSPDCCSPEANFTAKMQQHPFEQQQKQQHLLHHNSSYSDDINNAISNAAVTPDDRQGDLSGQRPIGRAIVKSTNGRTPLATVQAPHQSQLHQQNHHNSLLHQSSSLAAKPPAAGTTTDSSGSKARVDGGGSTNKRRPTQQMTRAEKFAELERMPRVPFNSALAAVADNRMNTGQAYQGEDNFNKLSDEIILSIFRHLPKKALVRCGQVSRRFHVVSLDESLWVRLDLGGRSVRAGGLGRAISRGLIVLRLSQTTIAEPVFTPSDLPTVDYMSRLQYLDLSMANITTTALLELLLRCRQLKKLSVEHIRLDAAICEQIAANRDIEVLNLTMAMGLQAPSVRLMLANLRKLQSLNISWTGLDHDGVRALVECVSPRLLRLNVAGCRKSMTDLMLFQLVQRCPDLIELDLSDCSVLTSEAIQTVCDLKSLEYLSLSRCYNIAVAAYLTINELLSLAYLDIFGVLSDPALAMLQTSFPEVAINKFLHSAVARPTVGSRRTSVWGQRTRD